MKKSETLTSKFISKWTDNNHKIFNPDKKNMNFMEFDNPDDTSFFKDVVTKYIIKDDPIENINEDDKIKLLIFFLVQTSSSIAPNDNHEFVLRVLKPLSQNPIFKFAVQRVVSISKLKSSKDLNLPFSGGYCLTNTENCYVFAFPHTPSEIFLISLSSEPPDYDESYLFC